MTQRQVTILLLFFLIGCASKEDPRLIELRTPGKSRTEIHEVLGPPRESTIRPSTGWNYADARGLGAERVADSFEKEKGAIVQTAESYWVPRGIMGLGVYWDYYLYDQSDHLLHYSRRFVD